MLVSIPILLASSFVMFGLVTISGDPLAALRQSTDPNREQTMAAIRQRLDLDKSFIERYWDWITGIFRGDFGQNRDGQDVAVLLKQAIGATLRLVLIATVISILLGIFVGVISAVRQYSVIDYGSTFAAFLFFSLPIFWVAVLLKEFGAIKFNNYLEGPGISRNGALILAILAAVFFAGIAGQSWQRRISAGVGAGAVTLGALYLIDRTDWLSNPGLSRIALVIVAVIAACVATALFAPLTNRRVLGVANAAAIAGFGGSLLFGSWIDDMSWTRMFLLLLMTIATGLVIGAALGGEIDRRPAMQSAAVATFFVAIAVVFDRLLSAWSPGRTIATIGPRTPNLDVPFWETQIDAFGHQVLPSLAISLVGFAGFMRFTRASMLETLGADYVRTAKAKGLPPSQVVLRHAFRTGLIPVMTLVALSLGGIIDGVVITEQVFGWKGMGSLFIEGLRGVDPYPVMGTLLVTSVMIVLANALADIMYAYLDPRIRS